MEPLGHDEFQHLFLAWNNAQGERLYVDTFDTHGPLFTLINTVVFSLTGPPAGAEVYTLFRAGSLLALLGIATMVFRAAGHLTHNTRTAYLAGFLFLTLTPILNKGIEIRPDVLQNLLWMMCVALVATDLDTKDQRRYGVAGLLLGLAGATNTKAALGALALGCFFLVQLAFEPTRRRERCTAYVTLILASLTGFALVYVPFVFSGTVAEALHYTLVAPFYLAGHHDMGEMPSLWPVLTTTHALFTMSAYIGFYQLFKGQAAVTATHSRFLVLLTLITTFGTLQVGHSQILLISLPLLSIVAAVGLQWCLTQCSTDIIRWIAVFAVLIPGPALHTSMLIDSYTQREAQNQLLEHTLSNLSRDEIIGTVWSNCGGYSFNPSSRFLWMGNYSAWLSEQMYQHGQGDRQQFKQEERLHLEDERVRTVIARMNTYHSRDLGEETQRYLTEHFTQSHEACLWTRKPAPMD